MTCYDVTVNSILILVVLLLLPLNLYTIIIIILKSSWGIWHLYLVFWGQLPVWCRPPRKVMSQVLSYVTLCYSKVSAPVVLTSVFQGKSTRLFSCPKLPEFTLIQSLLIIFHHHNYFLKVYEMFCTGYFKFDYATGELYVFGKHVTFAPLFKYFVLLAPFVLPKSHWMWLKCVLSLYFCISSIF